MKKDIESKDQNIIETLKNLERLESLVEDSPHLFGFFFRFNDEEFYMLVNKIRASLPEELRRAGKIAQNSDKIMEAAQSEAEHSVVSARSEASTLLETARAEAARIIEEARATAGTQVQQAEAKSAALVEESEIVRIARAQSGDIVRRAEREADDIRAGADEYAREVLLALEQNIAEAMTQVEGRIGSVLGTIQRGRQALDRRKPEPLTGVERRENLAVSSANGTGKPTASDTVAVGNARG